MAQNPTVTVQTKNEKATKKSKGENLKATQKKKMLVRNSKFQQKQPVTFGYQKSKGLENFGYSEKR